MDILTAMKNRNSVRKYTDEAISKEIISELQKEIDICNDESGLHIQLVVNEPKAFSNFILHYGSFSGVRNYIALVGRLDTDFNELSGYYGQRIVLKAQMLGLNTCWVALTFSKCSAKRAVSIANDEKLGCVITLGYGKTQGVPHKSRPVSALCKVEGDMPEWFKKGMEAAMLAPTARNQQRFLFTLSGDEVTVKETGGAYSKVDLGIVKYHFEIGSGRKLC